MIVGLDLDNTIACYDKAIIALADKKLDLPATLPRQKLEIRDYLVNTEREEDWTRFQGELYGPGMAYARPFPGSIQAISSLISSGYRVKVISHRTRFPYAGNKYDLHAFASKWVSKYLASYDVLVSMHETKDEKIDEIQSSQCSVFVDDLISILGATKFPHETMGVLFSPYGINGAWKGSQITRWSQLQSLVQTLEHS